MTANSKRATAIDINLQIRDVILAIGDLHGQGCFTARDIHEIQPAMSLRRIARILHSLHLQRHTRQFIMCISGKYDHGPDAVYSKYFPVPPAGEAR